jgi:hypothetical protein
MKLVLESDEEEKAIRDSKLSIEELHGAINRYDLDRYIEVCREV